MTKPQINVTPLIDVLLVLLIIFMVVTPLKPSALDARIPKEPTDVPIRENPLTLAVLIETDQTLQLNKIQTGASVQQPEPLVELLRQQFEQRRRNLVFSEDSNGTQARIEKTVFIRAPRGLDYGSVARVIDAVKLAGADPVSLQIDDLD